jgi:uncharacterized protein YbjT (DUF2867 family)
MILVTGATGNIGHELVRELDASGAPFRILVRDPARAAGMSARAERAVGDLGDPASLQSAFDGITKLFLVTHGIGADYAANAIEAARGAGVNRIALVSSYAVGITPPPEMARWHCAREDIVRGSGIPATILRPGGFMTNAFDWLPTIREAGYVLDPIGPGRYAPIDPADIAAVAALVLTREGHQGQVYTLTGAEALTVADQVRILAAAAGRTIAIREPANLDEAVRARFPNGAPPALATAIIEGFQQMRADTVGFRTNTVARLLGRPPRTFADWCARNAAAFA